MAVMANASEGVMADCMGGLWEVGFDPVAAQPHSQIAHVGVGRASDQDVSSGSQEGVRVAPRLCCSELQLPSGMVLYPVAIDPSPGG